ncbi:MAG TPA: ABC transporter permease subunit [Acidobacteriota bacterium]|nr:ABC transporter permease subunit [Acidobacteriota bacterium]
MASPFRVLVGKELLAFRPFLAFSVFLAVLDSVLVLLTEYPTRVRLDFLTTQHSDSAAVLFFIFAALALALTSGILLREYDERTLEFLDGLPVSRSQLFAAKVLAALGTVMAYPLLASLEGLVMHAFARDSLHQAWHLGLLAQSLWLDGVLILFLIGVGTLLSLLRRFSWMAALLMIFSFRLAAGWFPALEGYSPLVLIAPPIRGGLYVVPWKAVLALGSIGLLSLLLAWVQFARGSDWLLIAWGRFQRSTPGKILLVLALFPVLGVCIFLLASFALEDPPPAGVQVDSDLGSAEVRFPDWKTAELRTQLYEFVYPSNLRSRVLELAPVADAAGRKVFDFFQTEPGEPIAVDATANDATHYAGLAEWQSITLALAHQPDLKELEGTLVHETAHVLIDELSNRRLRDHFNTVRVFHEGLASYLEHDFVLTEKRAQLRFPAIVLRDRRLFDFELMADSTRLEAELGIEVIYSLGERLAATLVKGMGQDGIVCLLRNPDLAAGLRHLQGVPFWQAWIQSCGHDLESLLGDFYLALDQDARRLRGQIDALPRPRGRIEVEEGNILVYVLAPGLPKPWEPVCRFKSDPQASVDDVHVSYAYLEEPCRAEAQSIAPNGTFYLQIGITNFDAGYTLYEPWFPATTTPAAQ